MEKKNGLAIASLVLAVIGVCLAFIPLVNTWSIVLGILALIFGIIGIFKCGKRGIAIAGTVLAVFCFACGIGMKIVYAKAAVGALTKTYSFLSDLIDDNNDVDAEDPGDEDTEQVTTTTTAKKGDIDPPFKKALDGYESFFDDYIAFMKKYKESKGTDLSILSEYSEYATKYAENMSKMSEWKSKDLNAEELAYYLEVNSRITKKLLEVTQ